MAMVLARIKNFLKTLGGIVYVIATLIAMVPLIVSFLITALGAQLEAERERRRRGEKKNGGGI